MPLEDTSSAIDGGGGGRGGGLKSDRVELIGMGGGEVEDHAHEVHASFTNGIGGGGQRYEQH